jgi:hypothetical protein
MARPEYIMDPESWTKVLPPHFITARDQALIRARAYEQQHGLGGEDQRHIGEVESYDDDDKVMNGNYERPVYNGVSEEYETPQGSVHATFDQEHLSTLSALRGVDHLDGMNGFVPHLEERFSDSMQYTADSPHYYDNQPLSPTIGSNVFRLPNSYSDDFNDQEDVPIDETIATQQYQRGTRMDPPEDEPPSLSKHEEMYDSNGIIGPSMSMEQSFEQQGYQEAEFPHDHFSPSSQSEYDDSRFIEQEQEVGESYQDEDHYYEDEQGNSHHYAPEYNVVDEQFMANVGLNEVNGRDRSVSPGKSLIQRHVPPVSPRKEAFSMPSAAIKPQVSSRRNRKLAKDTLSPTSTGTESNAPGFTLRTAESESNGTWASGSDFTGDDSSAWTDGSSMPPDRTSRRALILQMAKARMKKDTPDKPGFEEKKVDSHFADTSDFDLTGDLD